MENTFPTFAHQDGHVLAFHDNTVIASGTEFAKVAETAEAYFENLREEERKALRHKATHITTPNGLKGKILSRVPTVWGEEITVRVENGEIARYATAAGDEDRFTYTIEAAAPTASYAEYFQSRLDEDYDPGIQGLTARLNTLDEVQTGVRSVIGSVNHSDLEPLHKIALTAEIEKNEVREALDHLASADAEAYVPPTPQVFEQADMGRSAHDSWLDVTARQMIAESESEDFDKLLEEGPTVFASTLEPVALASTGTTAEMARQFVTSKTAGFQGDAVDEYRDRFVAATEAARRRELSYRNDVAAKEATQREASVEDVPDEGLFL